MIGGFKCWRVFEEIKGSCDCEKWYFVLQFESHNLFGKQFGKVNGCHFLRKRKLRLLSLFSS
jgi:hypothetical protein